ncbi:lytic transglycosylase domain-containing protein [Cupriavidus pauculus]|uniref:lytic transglycosylase domain-containing protein n=1 Tax=Burkholderiaceae TaxID=119060 RepID=UPI000492F8F0|nr:MULTISPECIES: lytic transglycosylase domain-containing protein [Burkholderiaceae]MCM3609142.1 lytic transglycosylase domain-containing protein [Cupriavidus pauculus]
MDAMALPPVIYREACIAQAVAHYQPHPDLLRAVIAAEGGTTGKIRRNDNGSFDMGLMQINSVHLPELARFGITQDMLVNNECLNIMIGAYYLQKNILTGRDFWHGVGSYHSKTPEKNTAYQYRVWENLQRIQGAAR